MTTKTFGVFIFFYNGLQFNKKNLFIFYLFIKTNGG